MISLVCCTTSKQFRGHVSFGLFRPVGREIFIRFSVVRKLPKYAQTHPKCDSPPHSWNLPQSSFKCFPATENFLEYKRIVGPFPLSYKNVKRRRRRLKNGKLRAHEEFASSLITKLMHNRTIQETGCVFVGQQNEEEMRPNIYIFIVSLTD